MKRLSFLLLALTAACSLFAQSPYQFKELTDLPYMEEASEVQQLNLLIPENSESAPLFIWIGGGAWSFVDRHQEMDFARQMAKQGIAVASVGHRLSAAVWADSTQTTGVQHPAHIEDIARAFVWLYEQADTYGYDKEQMFIGGFSSGAHLAALLSMDGKYLEALGNTKDNIRGVIPVGGAYDILHYREFLFNSAKSHLAEQHVDVVFGATEEAQVDASPATYLDQLKTPMLLISDNNLYPYTKVFEDMLKEAKYEDVDILHISRYGHGPLWKHLSHDEDSEYRDIMVNFIKRRRAGESKG